MQPSQIRGVIVRAQRLVVSVARLVLRELDMSATGGSRQFAKRLKSAFGQRRRLGRPVTSGQPLILLQKSKVASVRIFGETLKREEIDDSYNLSRATEVAYEFSVRRRSPSDPYTKTALTARRILDHLCKTTFATESARNRYAARLGTCSHTY